MWERRRKKINFQRKRIQSLLHRKKAFRLIEFFSSFHAAFSCAVKCHKSQLSTFFCYMYEICQKRTLLCLKHALNIHCFSLGSVVWWNVNHYFLSSILSISPFLNKYDDVCGTKGFWTYFFYLSACSRLYSLFITIIVGENPFCAIITQWIFHNFLCSSFAGWWNEKPGDLRK